MSRRPLPFTFGNHMHWVDMQWLWGYRVLPDSIDDMLALCAAVGARGNVNFDGVGYEKLAAEDPDALQRLREAVHEGTIEVVGATYGQPYGLFQGGESNLRQRSHGARVVRRLLGVWPRTFWEEEFDFFPQLPQILRGCGFTGASLFFQWTWHTPTVPEEQVPLVQWEGCDGSRLPAVTRTALCLHQWPEDFDGKLERALQVERPALVQWVELMPSPDWMCRSEVLLPRLRELFADDRFELRPCTLGALITQLDDGSAPRRHYTMDDVFHGMTLGKNGDRHPRASRRAERLLLAAESLMATLGLLGRPYASWDVYPAWELDEGWRELLQAQHHDNHECEGLCGSVGHASLQRAATLAGDVLARGHALLAERAGGTGGEQQLLVHNPLGFARDVEVALPQGAGVAPRRLVIRDVPAFGWASTQARRPAELPAAEIREEPDAWQLDGGPHAATLCRRSGALLEVTGEGHTLRGRFAVPHLPRPNHGESALPAAAIAPLPADDGLRTTFARGDDRVDITVRPAPAGAGLLLAVEPHTARPAPGYAGALRLRFDGLPEPLTLRTDTPYAAGTVRADGRFQRKYPSGDWMTTTQVFEDVERPFTCLTFADLLLPDGSGLLLAHDGSQGGFRVDGGVELVLDAYDPWDEDRYTPPRGPLHVLLRPHGPLRDSERARHAALLDELHAAVQLTGSGAPDTPAPPVFGPLCCEPTNVLVTAFHREHRKTFEHVDGAFGPDVRNPYVLRLVEYDGEPAAVELRVPGACPLAARTDLLGTVQQELTARPCEPPEWSPPELPWSALTLQLRPREIATLMLDLELGRHQPRNLDAHRHVWAKVHRRGDTGGA